MCLYVTHNLTSVYCLNPYKVQGPPGMDFTLFKHLFYFLVHANTAKSLKNDIPSHFEKKDVSVTTCNGKLDLVTRDRVYENRTVLN